MGQSQFLPSLSHFAALSGSIFRTKGDSLWRLSYLRVFRATSSMKTYWLRWTHVLLDWFMPKSSSECHSSKSSWVRAHPERVASWTAPTSPNFSAMRFAIFGPWSDSSANHIFDWTWRFGARIDQHEASISFHHPANLAAVCLIWTVSLLFSWLFL